MLSTPNGTFFGKVLLVGYLSPSAITHKNVAHFCGARGGRKVELGNYPARFQRGTPSLKEGDRVAIREMD